MSYSSNPYLPKARRWAVNLVIKEGMSVTAAAMKAGVHRTTLHRWLVRAKGLHGNSGIPTISSRPHSHPKQLSDELRTLILSLRAELKRCGAYIHAVLRRRGIVVSIASVNRVIARSHYNNSWHGIQAYSYA